MRDSNSWQPASSTVASADCSCWHGSQQQVGLPADSMEISAAKEAHSRGQGSQQQAWILAVDLVLWDWKKAHHSDASSEGRERREKWSLHLTSQHLSARPQGKGADSSQSKNGSVDWEKLCNPEISPPGGREKSGIRMSIKKVCKTPRIPSYADW